MGKQFTDGVIVSIAGHHRGKVIGEDPQHPGIYNVEVLTGPDAGKTLGYVFGMLKVIKNP